MDVIRRPFAEGRFVPTILGGAPGPWGYGSPPAFAGDVVHLGFPWGDYIELNDTVPWSAGDMVIGIQVSTPVSTTLPSCYVSVATSTSSGFSFAAPLVHGWNERVVTAPTPFDLNFLRIGCLGGTGSTAAIDFVTLQNGSYEWAPASDLRLEVDDAGLSGGGQNTVVVRGALDTGCWAGADLGGVAWSSDCSTWTTVNGADLDMQDERTLGVWDIFPVSDEFAFVVTGRAEPGNYDPKGALQYTDDMGANWSVVPTEDPFGIDRDLDECRARDYDGKNALSRSGGRLIDAWSTAETDWFFVVNHANYLSEKNRDVYLMLPTDTDSPADGSYDTFDLMGDVFEYTSADVLPLSQMEGDNSRNGKYVGAVKLVDWEDGWASLFIGVKTGAQGRSGDDQNLFRCDFNEELLLLVFDEEETILCDEVSGGQELDVRDIEYMPDLDDPGSGLLLVADGGRRYLNGALATDGDCEHEEGQVWALQVDAASTSAMWSLDEPTAVSRTCVGDASTTTEPGWNSAQCSASFNKRHPVGTGDIRMPGLVAGDYGYATGEVTGITILDEAIEQDSDGNGANDRLVAPILVFIDAPKSASDIFPRVYKAEVLLDANLGNGHQPVFNVAVDDRLSWTPLWDFHDTEGWNPLTAGTDPYDDGYPYNRAQRVNAIMALSDDTWPYDQMSLDTWVAAWPIDGTPVAHETNGIPDLLVSSGYGIFRLMSTDGVAGATLITGANIGDPLCVGWDSVYGNNYDCGGGAYADIDYMPWKFEMARATTAFEETTTFDFGMTVAQDLWFCATCDDDGSNDGEGYYTTDDIGSAFFHGPDVGGSARDAADVDCHFDSWGEGGLAVDGVEVAVGNGYESALWMSVGSQSAGGTTGQALFRKATDGTWCYLTTPDSLTTGPRQTYLLRNHDADVRIDHACKWEYTPPPNGYWNPCDSGDGTSLESFGRPTSVVMGVQYETATSRVDPLDTVAVAAFLHDVADTTGSTDNGGGLAILHTNMPGSREVTTLNAIPGVDPLLRPDSTGNCTVTQETLFSDTPRLALDTVGSWYTNPTSYHLRLYLGFWGRKGAMSNDCALWEVTDEIVAGVRTTVWTSINLDPMARDCPLSYQSLNGVRTAEWAPHTVFAFGGYNGNGAVCAINTGGPGGLPEVAYTGALIVRDVAPHPHVSNVLVVGTKWKYTELGQTTPPGIQVVDLRYDVNLGMMVWAKAHMNTDTLETPGVEVLDWARYPGYTTELYIGSHGSGPLSAGFTW